MSHCSTVVTVKYISRVLLFAASFFPYFCWSYRKHGGPCLWQACLLWCIPSRPSIRPQEPWASTLALYPSLHMQQGTYSTKGAVSPHLPNHTVITVRPWYPTAEKVSHPPHGRVLPSVPNVQPQMAIPLPIPWKGPTALPGMAPWDIHQLVSDSMCVSALPSYPWDDVRERLAQWPAKDLSPALPELTTKTNGPIIVNGS